MIDQFDEETSKLLSLLERAAEEMISYGNQSTFSYFDTCEDVGLYIQDILNKVKAGEIKELTFLLSSWISGDLLKVQIGTFIPGSSENVPIETFIPENIFVPIDTFHSRNLLS